MPIPRQILGSASNPRLGHVVVTHSKRYRFFVEINGKQTQGPLDARETIRYLLNALETSDNPHSDRIPTGLSARSLL